MRNLNEVLTDLQESQHTAVPLPVEKSQFHLTIENFTKFLTLPQELKDSIYFKNDPENRGSEVGYMRYLREKGHTDNREYFHYNPAADKRFSSQIERIPELKKLIDSVRPIYDISKQTFRSLLSVLEEKYPNVVEPHFQTEPYETFYLRVLKYDRQKAGDFLAKGHYDRGSCTLALAESAPGLRIGLNQEKLKPAKHQKGHAIFMPGIKFPDLTGPEIKPAWHDVVQESDNTYNEDIARWAIVFFSDYKSDRKISYADAHTPKDY